MMIACVYAALVALGMAMRAAHVFDESAPAVLSRIMLNLTLPASVICAFIGFDGDVSLYFLILIGFVCSLMPFLAAWLVTWRLQKGMRAFSMLNVCGYNIGCFSLPIVQGVAGGAGAAAVCLFDIGNALVMTGGSYAGANGFLAMLTAGLMFSPADFCKFFRSAILIVTIRFATGCALAACAWFFLPYSETVRFSLMLAAFAPVSALAPVFSEKCCGEGARSGLTLSLSVALSLIVMLALTTWRLYL